MLLVPMRAGEDGVVEVGLAFSIFEVAADIVVEERDISRGDSGGLRIVLCALAQRIESGTGEARIEAAGGEVFVVLELSLIHI